MQNTLDLLFCFKSIDYGTSFKLVVLYTKPIHIQSWNFSINHGLCMSLQFCSLQIASVPYTYFAKY